MFGILVKKRSRGNEEALPGLNSILRKRLVFLEGMGRQHFS
jgi:hypothetical protein